MPRRGRSLLKSMVDPAKDAATHKVKIDLVTEHPDTGVFAVILVETGPWVPGTEQRELRRIQDRLYDCVDVAVDGLLADKYPDSRGRPVRIQLDTYDIPETLVRPFFERFASHVAKWSQLQQDIVGKQNVKSLTFEYNPRTIDGRGPA